MARNITEKSRNGHPAKEPVGKGQTQQRVRGSEGQTQHNLTPTVLLPMLYWLLVLQSLDVAYELKQQQHLVGLIHEVDCLPSYFISGGLVFAPLSWPLLEVSDLKH